VEQFAMSFVWPSLVFFLAFFAVAAVDGVYFHLRRFRLWQHGDTRLEHALHTGRAVLIPPTIAALFTPGRGTLYMAAGLVAADLLIAALDVIVERRSRERFGGLPHGEYVTHLVATVFHTVAITLAFVGRIFPEAGPATACPSCAQAVVIVLVAGATLGAVQHVALLLRGARVEDRASPRGAS
jgi:hypothetical protein